MEPKPNQIAFKTPNYPSDQPGELIRVPLRSIRPNIDTFSTPEGDITITWPAGLSHEDLEEAYGWMDIVRRKMGRAAGGPVVAPDSLQELRWQYDKQIGELRMRLDAVGAPALNDSQLQQMLDVEPYVPFTGTPRAVPTLEEPKRPITVGDIADPFWSGRSEDEIRAQYAEARSEFKEAQAVLNALIADADTGKNVVFLQETPAPGQSIDNPLPAEDDMPF